VTGGCKQLQACAAWCDSEQPCSRRSATHEQHASTIQSRSLFQLIFFSSENRDASAECRQWARSSYYKNVTNTTDFDSTSATWLNEMAWWRNVTLRTMDLRSKSHEFNSRSGCYQVVTVSLLLDGWLSADR